MRPNHYLILFLIAGSLWSCGSPDGVAEEPNPSQSQEFSVEEVQTPMPTLKEALDARKATSDIQNTEERKRINTEGIAAIEASGITRTAIQVGDTAPDFLLTNALDREVMLSEELKRGPVVLTWYRGGWCPYCNITLVQMQEALSSFESAGALMIALSPELPDQSISTKEKHNLEFEVLSDIGSEVARKYGILYHLTDEMAAAYNESFDLDAYNGDSRHELPLTATYVIDRNGVVRYAFLDADYHKRAEPADILAVLKKLK